MGNMTAVGKWPDENDLDRLENDLRHVILPHGKLARGNKDLYRVSFSGEIVTDEWETPEWILVNPTYMIDVDLRERTIHIEMDPQQLDYDQAQVPQPLWSVVDRDLNTIRTIYNGIDNVLRNYARAKRFVYDGLPVTNLGTTGNQDEPNQMRLKDFT